MVTRRQPRTSTRKPDPRVTMQVDLDRALHTAAAARAASEDRSLASLVRVALRAYLEVLDA